MKSGKKLLSSLLAALLLISHAPIKTQAAEGWQQTGSTWYYYKNSQKVKGWMKEGYCWYFLDYNTGAMKTGWVADGQSWYYLGPSGVMQSDYWVVEDGQKYYVDETGVMVSGEAVVLDEKDSSKKVTCTFASNGLLTGQCTEYTEPSGEWKKEGSNYYYYIDGVKQKGWITINDKTYYLGGNDYHMYWGIQTINGKKYEFANNGALIGEYKVSDYLKGYDPEDYADEKDDLVALINKLRDDEDLDKLDYIDDDETLDKAAYARANEIYDGYANKRPDDETLEDLLHDVHVEYEFVEEYYVEAVNVTKAFKAFTEDRTAKRALLDEEFDTISIGVCEDVFVILIAISGEEVEEEPTEITGDVEDILDAINYYREEADVDELDTDSKLDKAADKIAYEFAKAYVNDKEEPDYEAILDKNKVLYDYADVLFVEDVEEYDEYASIVDDWMDSRSNKRIVTSEDYTYVGVGVAEYQEVEYIAVVFIEVAKYGNSDFEEDIEEIMELINDEREYEDLDDYDLADDELADAAYDFVLGIIEGTSATKYKTYLDAHKVDYKSASYIVQKGIEDYDYDELIEIWMSSLTTSNKILSEKFTRAGIAIEEYNDVQYIAILLVEDKTTTSGSTSSSEADEDKEELFDLINTLRIMNGEYYLDEADKDVVKIADQRAYEIARYGKASDSLSTDLKPEKITGATEIVVEDADTVTEVIFAIRSNADLLDDYDEIAIGVGTYKGTTCWSIILY